MENWDIKKGDYERSEFARRGFQKKVRRKKLIKTVMWASVYLIIIGALTYLIVI